MYSQAPLVPVNVYIEVFMNCKYKKVESTDELKNAVAVDILRSVILCCGFDADGLHIFLVTL
jgi:hypothetical protein